MTPDKRSTKALGYLRRLLPMPSGWSAEDHRIHAGCEFADEQTMPAVPPFDNAEQLGRWCNDLAATHNTGDLCRMVFNLLAVDARLPKTYTVIHSLYEHDCPMGCDSKYAVNCNCQGKCHLHKKLVEER